MCLPSGLFKLSILSLSLLLSLCSPVCACVSLSVPVLMCQTAGKTPLYFFPISHTELALSQIARNWKNIKKITPWPEWGQVVSGQRLKCSDSESPWLMYNTRWHTHKSPNHVPSMYFKPTPKPPIPVPIHFQSVTAQSGGLPHYLKPQRGWDTFNLNIGFCFGVPPHI